MSKLIPLAFCFALVLLAANAKVILEDVFDDGFNPDEGNTLWKWVTTNSFNRTHIPSASFDNCAVHNVPGEAYIDIDPLTIKNPMETPYGWFANEICKVTPLNFPDFITLHDEGILSVTIKASTQIDIPLYNPFSSATSIYNNDPRFGACGFSLESSSGVLLGLYMTGDAVWSYHSRPKYPWNSIEGDWDGFFDSRKVSSRSLQAEYNILKIEYNSKKQEAYFYVDNVLRRTVKNVGYTGQFDSIPIALFSSSNANSTDFEITDFGLAIGCQLNMDKLDTRSASTEPGLLNNRTPLTAYKMPVSFVLGSNETDYTNMAFGQVMRFQMKRILVENKASYED